MRPRITPRSYYDITSLRRSLLRYIYGKDSKHVEDELLNRTRLYGPQKSLFTATVREYQLRHPDQRIVPKPIWSVATGTYEPRTSLTTAHIVPDSFGKALFRQVFGKTHTKLDLSGPANALILPTGLALALDDWAITLMPADKTDGLNLKDIEMRVLDPTHEGLQMPVEVEGVSSSTTWADMDGLRLAFREGCDMRPAVEYLYFWHRCALQSFEIRDDDADLGEFWGELVGELRGLKGFAATFGLDWELPPDVPACVPVPEVPRLSSGAITEKSHIPEVND